VPPRLLSTTTHGETLNYARTSQRIRIRVNTAKDEYEDVA